MSQELATVLRAVRALSHRDKLEVLHAITHDLQQGYALAEGNAAFWSPKNLDEIISTQNAPIIDDISLLGADFWSEDETSDHINAYNARMICRLIIAPTHQRPILPPTLPPGSMPVCVSADCAPEHRHNGHAAMPRHCTREGMLYYGLARVSKQRRSSVCRGLPI